MKKKTNVIPFLLLILYYLFIGSNKNIVFEIKLVVLISVVIISALILYQKLKNNTISKNKIIIMLVFLGIALLNFLWFWNKI
jgi:hypothetical protein